MAQNTTITTQLVLNHILRVLENNLVFGRCINRQYDNLYAREGAKIGDTARARMPLRVLVTEGTVMQAQDYVEEYRNIKLTDRFNIGLQFSSDELTVNIDDFVKRIVVPSASQLANTIDSKVAQLYKYVGNSVGTPGTTPSTAAVMLAAKQKLVENAVPDGRLFATVNPAAEAALVTNLTNLYNPQDKISEQFKRGRMGTDTFGYSEINMSQNIQMHRTGTRDANAITTVATTVGTEGQSVIQLSQASVTTTINAGDVFTVSGVNAVNPQSRQSTGSLYQFVALADATAVAGVWSVTVYPMYGAAQQLATMERLPQAGDTVTFMGAANTSYSQNLVYHEDAFTLVSVDLIKPKNIDISERIVHNGISLRLTRAFDITNDRMPTRLDYLGATAALRHETAVRIWGA